MDQENKSKSPKLGWTLEELACSLSVSVPFLRLEVKRGRLKAAHLGRRVVLLDRDVQRYLAEASDAIEGLYVLGEREKVTALYSVARTLIDTGNDLRCNHASICADNSRNRRRGSAHLGRVRRTF
jgi:hypothetical protein